jgi:uncharacterized pyridoxamine 5'-phosphate oxidase family protein
MNIHIATAGEKSPVEAAFRYQDKLGNIDKLYIVTGEGYKEKFKNAQFNIETKVLEVNSFSFESVVSCLVGIYTGEKTRLGKHDKIFMNLTGGTNILSVAAYVISMFLGIDCYYLLNEGPIFFEHSDRLYCISEKSKQCLKLFENRDEVVTSKSNSRHFKILEKKGLVQFSPHTKKKHVGLTPEGKFYFGILKESNWKI